MGSRRDDLDLFLDEQRNDPAFAAAYEDAQARADLLARCVRLRKESRRSQAEVARAMGSTQSAVSELESGATDPQFSTLQRYVRAVGGRLDVTIQGPAGTKKVTSKPPARKRSAA
ncbi:helix-turn-helix domain-containing protein [Actinopolymorpha alba]|uniref:helix-turn-helix domain-containing protein n=1 Tax=Actinopolymorpha alba TaxID=533267 RepID=UPI0003773012|nr:helix-turn-helix transcriptional regulator [Actinopolymorpha alba]